METFKSGQIRNIALTGHAGSGKTTLAEAMLFKAGVIDRPGNIEAGTTVCDFDPEEIKRKVSLSLALAPLTWNNCKINILDTPGLFDFEGEMLEGLSACDGTILVVSGKSGVSVGTGKSWKRISKLGMPRAFFISKIDDESADFYRVFEELKHEFGAAVCPVVVPFESSGGTIYINMYEMKAYQYNQKGQSKEVDMPDTGHRLQGLAAAISEAVAETSDELFDKYFSGGTFTREELIKGIHTGIKDGSIAPVFCGSGTTAAGIDMLLDSLVELFPSPVESGTSVLSGESEITIGRQPDEPTAAYVFKTLADPYVGKLSYIKVLSGTIRPDSVLVNARTGQPEKCGKLYMQRGKKQIEVQEISAGDIGSFAKLAAQTGDTLCASSRIIRTRKISYPPACLAMAVAPKSKGDEDKISQSLHRLTEEDPTLQFEINSETRQQIIRGLGEQHLDYVASKLKNKFGVDVVLSKPLVQYRETIRKKVRAEGKHKKQTGGHGQYGHVFVEFEPCPTDDFVFEEKVFGGSVPRNFFPAVEKGLRECTAHGVLAGYPVVNLKATLVDGSYHPVDSSEAAFKAAAALAFKSGISQASPVLLEPVGNLKAWVPESFMGDVIGEINRRRGRVLGMEPDEDGFNLVTAEAPEAEMLDFSVVLRSITQGRGYYTFEFERYEEAPPQISQMIVTKSQKVTAAN